MAYLWRRRSYLKQRRFLICRLAAIAIFFQFAVLHYTNKTKNARNEALLQFSPHNDSTALLQHVAYATKHGIPLNETLVLPAFCNLRNNILAAPEYGLATCQIEKSLSTVRDAIFCYLDNPQLFEENKRILHNEFWSSREPDQFGPDFRCLGCARDMQCFLEKLFHLFYRMSSKREYLRREVWYVARHFAPQTWYCDFKESLKGYVLFKYYGADKDGEMTKFLRVILSRVKVEQKRIDYIIDGIVGKNTAHSTTSLDSRSAYKRQLLNNGYLCRLIVAIYYHDFLVFNFEDPATLCFHSTAS
ncbi:hypothetical protein Q1695_012607 [Nippostrongylus brasiliensis]|nr:hypothetical protein Q1695_012607 [Nippostrongylus brasiliensis]